MLRRGRIAVTAVRLPRYASSATVVESKKHRKVTALNDNGSVPWGDLSPMEKASRTAQQTFNFGLIAAGAIATIAVAVVMYTDVFSPNSTTSQFSQAVDRIRKDKQIADILGPDIRAFGEASWNKWRRNRPIASQIQTDKLGTERLYMHFNVAGPLNEGVAHLHMIRRRDESEWHYGSLHVDVQGRRIVLESATEKRTGKFLGIRWT